MRANAKLGLIAVLALLTTNCSSRKDTLTLYPFSFDEGATNDAIHRYEIDYKVKAGTGSYRTYAFNGFTSDCVMVIPQEGTERGIHHAGPDDVDGIYCYDQETGHFSFRL